MSHTAAVTPDQFATFGELLKYLRRRGGLTQRELSIAVGYSDTQISRLEQNQRVPDAATLTALFVPALGIEEEAEWAARLLELAAKAREVVAAGLDRSAETPFQSRYQLEEEIGRGGMGVVYRAHDSLLDRQVAVKVLTDSGLGAEGRERLRREAQAAAKLNHPNVVAIYDVGEIDGQPCIVMELVWGETLGAQRRREIEAVVAVARQVCAALEHAHAHGIIHRDLKPENILLGPDGTAKLMDFGLARSRGASRLTEEGALVGTVFYLAPEQAMGQEIDGRADLYALGVVLYELAAGRLPFVSDDPIAVISQHLHSPVVPPGTHNPEIPAWLDDLIVRLLSKQPETRPASAGEVLRALVASTPPAHHGAPPPNNNLPLQLTSFIGRGKEIAEVKQLFSKTRLLTLTGSGGTGKTRLSLQVAVDLLPSFADGAWFIELAPLADSALAPQTVATALGLRVEGNRPVLTVLIERLREKTILLVLDNCEHLIDSCARLAEALLSTCPDLRILASSREALGIPGETAYRVPSLSLPEASAPIETLVECEAVRLFIERASAALPDFEVASHNAPAIAEVCRRLDGIPLAIELAAARVSVLRVEQIVARLSNRFRLLTGGSRTALPRQQTLRATIDWSHDLLQDDERILLRRLSVFAGGWTLEAAEAIGAGDGIEKEDVLDTLTRLVNKSLVVAERKLGAEAPYRLLETIRQYAREKLTESDEEEKVREWHRDWFLASAERAEPELWRGRDQAGWLDRLEAEHDNLRTALDWALETEQVEAGMRLAVALWWFWMHRGYYQEGRHRLEAGLAQRRRLPKPLLAQLLRAAGRLAARQGDFDLAEVYGEESVALFRALGDEVNLARSVRALAATITERDDLERAQPYTAENLALCRERGDKWGIAEALTDLGWNAALLGDYARGIPLLEESLALERELENIYGIAFALFALGISRLLFGEANEAAKLLQESLTLFHHMEHKWFIGGCLDGLAGVASARHQPMPATRLWGASDQLLESIGGSTPTFWTHYVEEPILASIRSQLDEAAFEAAYAEGRAMAMEQAIQYALQTDA